jgi:hypothetical protein
MLQELSDWLEQTALHTIFADTTRLETWLIIPLSQTIHIMGVAVVMTAIGMLNLQLLVFALPNRASRSFQPDGCRGSGAPWRCSF